MWLIDLPDPDFFCASFSLSSMMAKFSLTGTEASNIQESQHLKGTEVQKQEEMSQTAILHDLIPHPVSLCSEFQLMRLVTDHIIYFQTEMNSEGED